MAGIPGLGVVAEPDATLALATDGSCDVFTVADEMLASGGTCSPSCRSGTCRPPSTSRLSAATAPSVPELVAALAGCRRAARAAGRCPSTRP